MPTALITGASRGLGLEFVKQYSQQGWRVLATCREPDSAGALRALAEGSEGKVSLHRLDVADSAQIDALAAELKGTPIDLLLNNAGTFGDRGGFGNSDYETWARTFAINTLGPMRMAEAFIDAVAASERKQIANITSKMGSIADNTSGSMYIYRSTKAALNMVTKCLALDLGSRGVTCVVLHPGWVKTDMGGASAPLDTSESIAGMRRVLDSLNPADTGKFFDYSGAEIPW